VLNLRRTDVVRVEIIALRLLFDFFSLIKFLFTAPEFAKNTLEEGEVRLVAVLL